MSTLAFHTIIRIASTSARYIPPLAVDLAQVSRNMALVSQHGYDLRLIPFEERSPEVCMAAVCQRGLAIAYVPEELLTEEMCRKAVASEGLALQYCTFIDEAMCEAAVRSHGMAYRFVPLRYRTESLRRDAIISRPEAALLMRGEECTPEILATATAIASYPGLVRNIAKADVSNSPNAADELLEARHEERGGSKAPGWANDREFVGRILEAANRMRSNSRSHALEPDSVAQPAMALSRR